MWIVLALGSAVFASLTAFFAKLGIEHVDSNLATAIRCVVIIVMAWGIVWATGTWRQIPDIDGKAWMFLILSGLATGASWLCYFGALKLGEASKVAPIDKLSVVFTMILAFIVLGEKVSATVLIGGGLIAAGSLVILL